MSCIGQLPPEVYNVIIEYLGSEERMLLRHTCRLARDFIPRVKDKLRTSYFASFSKELLIYGQKMSYWWPEGANKDYYFGAKLKVFKWCYKREDLKNEDPQELLRDAAKKGNIPVLKFLYRKIPSNERKDFKIPIEFCKNYKTAKWLIDNKIADTGGHHQEYLVRIVKDGDLELLDLMSCCFDLEEGLVQHCQTMKTFEWFEENFDDFTMLGIETSIALARIGSIEKLEEWSEKGCELGETTCETAARHGNFEVLKWLRQRDCLWDFSTCNGAAFSGRLDILKWCREQGCEWSEEVYYYAVANGHLDIIIWAHENSCPGFEDDDLDCLATREGHIHILEWLFENHVSESSQKVLLEEAKEARQYDVIDWLKKRF